MSPTKISPHQHLKLSDHIFGAIHKPFFQHTYKLASINGFDPVKSWSTAKSAMTLTTPDIIIFVTVE